MRRAAAVLCSALCTVLLALPACSGPRRAGRALPEEPPADFGVAVTVFTSGADALTPARYIVEPDGALRAATGPGATPRTFPPIVRRLDPAQRRGLWWLTLDTRAHEPAGPWATPSPDTYSAEGRTAILVSASFWGSRTSAAIPEEAETFRAARALADELAELSWVSPQR